MNPQEILAGAQDALTARRVFGEPVQADGVTVLPVAAIRGGGGGGTKGAEDGGGGFGVNAYPAGVFVVKNGDVTWRPAVNVNRIIAGAQLVAIVALLALRPLFARRAQNRA